jgi:hypothetical protein
LSRQFSRGRGFAATIARWVEPVLDDSDREMKARKTSRDVMGCERPPGQVHRLDMRPAKLIEEQ